MEVLLTRLPAVVASVRNVEGYVTTSSRAIVPLIRQHQGLLQSRRWLPEGRARDAALDCWFAVDV
jgi:hypothetical protein